jgi:hypothetical protein
MIRNCLKIAWCSLLKISGMAVAMLIGVWIDEELSHNKAFPAYDRIALLWPM